MIGWIEKECAEMSRIGFFYKKHGKLPQAENTFRLIVEMREKSGDSDSLELGMTYYALASIYADQCKFEAAKPLYKKAVEIYQKHDRANIDNVLWYSVALADLQSMSEKKFDFSNIEPLQREA
jgi:tetratricopeptide (TPR) repeat protein